MPFSNVLGQKQENDSIVRMLFTETQKYLQIEGINMRQCTDTAFQLLDKAEKLIYPDTNSRNRGELLFLKGFAFTNIDSIDKSLELYKKSLKIIGEKDNLTQYIHQEMAQIYSKTEKYKLYRRNQMLDSTIFCMKKALSLMDSLPEEKKKEELVKRQYGIIYDNLGGLYSQINNLDSSLYFYKLALEQREAVHTSPHPELAMTYNNIGTFFAKKNDYESAIKFFKKSTEIYSKLEAIKTFSVCLNIGVYYYKDKKYKKSRENLKKASKYCNGLLDSAKLDNHFGLLEFYEKNYKQAEIFFRKAILELEEFEKNSEKKYNHEKATYFSWLAQSIIKQNKTDSVIFYDKCALQLMEKTKNYENDYFYNSILANTGYNYMRIGKLDSAKYYLEKGISNIDNRRVNLFDILNEKIYSHLFILEFIKGNYEACFNIQEKRKAQKLLQLCSEKYLIENKIEDPETLSDYNKIKTKIDSANTLVTDAKRNNNLPKQVMLEKQLSDLHSEKRKFLKKIISKTPELSGILTNEGYSYDDFVKNKVLDKNQAIISYMNYENSDSLWIVLATNDTLIVKKVVGKYNMNYLINNYRTVLNYVPQTNDNKIYEYTENNKTLLFKAKTLKEKIGKRAFDINYKKHFLSSEEIYAKRESLNDSIYKILIYPIENELTNIKDLIIVPDAMLALLPFQALYKKENGERIFLPEKYNIQYTPSIKIFIDKKRRTKAYSKNKRQNMLIFANTKYAEDDTIPNNNINDLSDLMMSAGSRQRKYFNNFNYVNFGVKQIENISFQNSDEKPYILKDSALTEKNIFVLNKKSDLSKFKNIHWFVHGFYDKNNVEKSCLVLYNRAKDILHSSSDDNFLELNEIMKLNLKADVLTLGACETAEGKLIEGEGIYGMTYAFYVAGATRMFIFAAHGQKVKNNNNTISYKGTKIKIYSKRILDLLKDPKYLNPFYWSGIVLW